MSLGPFNLQWRKPSPDSPVPTPLPHGISRSYIPTTSGPLELLSALPSSVISINRTPLFFAHGGFGCASIWTSYMLFFASRGYPCYAISYRGHGASWYPGFLQMYFTGREAIAGDLVTGIEEVERLEGQRRKTEERVRVVLVAHSAGGALAQWVLSRGFARVTGLCMFAAVPGFGSYVLMSFASCDCVADVKPGGLATNSGLFRRLFTSFTAALILGIFLRRPSKSTTPFSHFKRPPLLSKTWSGFSVRTSPCAGLYKDYGPS
jgi:pimeloyl-ACP methyl ester carboxylesterase